MKKIVSFYLAAILIFTAAFPFTVYAAPPNIELNYSFNDNMTEGTQNAAPIHTFNSSNTIPDDRVFLSWDFSTTNSMMPGSYELYYPLDDNKVARFTVRRTGSNRATVDFQIEDGTYGSGVSPDVAAGKIIAPTAYEIHSNINLVGSTNYIPFNEYMAGNFNFDNAWGTQVVQETRANPKTDLIPKKASFNLSPGFGISMNYDQYNIHFKWESNGQFSFLTGGLKKGRIYDFTLTYWEGNDKTPAGQKTASKKIFSGFADEGVTVQPYANGTLTNSWDDRIDKSISASTDPGDKQVNLDITLVIPKIWDEVSRTFSKEPDASSGYRLPMTMTFSGGTKAINLAVDDLIGGSPKFTASSPWLSDGNHPPEIIKTNVATASAITLKLHDMDPSTMYSEVRISITNNMDLYCRTTLLGFGKVYTYIYYGINETGNDYNIWFYPYKSEKSSVNNDYEGEYSLYSTVGDPNVPLMSRKSSGQDSMLNFPLSFDPSEAIEETFYITFTPSTRNLKVRSQYLTFQPTFMPPIGMTENFTAKVASMLPKESTNDDKADLVMDFTWDIGSKTNIDYFFKTYPDKTLYVKYEFRRGESPDERNPAPFARLLLEITQSTTSSGALQVKFLDDPDSNLPGKLYYPPGKTEVIGTTVTSLGKYYVEGQVVIEAFRRTAEVAGKEMFCYPGVYFVNVTPVWIKDGVNDGDMKMSSSLYSSITISDIAPTEISPPQNLTAYDAVLSKTEVSFKLSWEVAGEGLQKYLKSRFPDPVSSVDVYMNLYISTNEELMRKTFSSYATYKDRLENNQTFGTTIGTLKHIYMSALNGNTPVKIETSGAYLGKEARDVLRDGKIVALTSIPLTDAELDAVITSGYKLKLQDYIIDGLDANGVYYIYADLVVETNESKPYVIVSKLSNLESITTSDDMEVPTGQDKVPPAPVAEIVNVGLKEATLRWNGITDTTENAVIEYEIIRLKDTQMPNEYLDLREDFADVWKTLTANKLGLKTDTANNVFKLFDGGSFGTTADITKYIPSLQTTPMSLRDVTLLPNQLYFYYIRTVKTVPGQEPLYSTWSRVTATTDTVKAPINLEINSTEKIDENTEVVIEFDALATPTELGTAYNLQYQLKRDTDSWSEPVTMTASVLRASAKESAEKGYTHYTYKITGLDPGTSYQVRVRMIDLNGDASMYSIIKDFRTGFDQSDYDTEKQTQDWVSRLKDLLEKLLKDPYWVSKNNAGELEIIYRPERFAALLSQTADSAMLLAQTNTNKATYYIPAAALAAANSANKGFKTIHSDSKYGDMEILISPKAISEAYNDAIFKIGDEIKQKNAADYYLKIQIDWAEVNNQIDGNDPVSQQATLTIAVIGSTKLVSTVDTELTAELSIKIADKLNDKRMTDQIRQNVKSSMTDEDFVKYIEKIVEDAKTELITAVNTKLNSTVKPAIPVTKLDKPVIIVASGLDPMASVSGYTYVNGSWMPTDITPYGDRKAISTYVPGTFIFTGAVIKIDGLDTMKYGGNIGGIVAKYSLQDVLGADNSINMKAPADRNMVIVSIARIAGAPKTADAVKWLKDNMNMTVSSRNLNQNITTEESVYLVMSLYEAKSKTKISTIKIRNYGATQNITGMNDNYKQHIRAAFELGIYTDSQMQPKGNITIQDLFEMLGRLDAKLNL